MQNLPINSKDKLDIDSKYHRVILRLVLFLSITLLVAGNVLADSRTIAKRIHDRLTGTAPSAAVLNEMVGLIDGGPAAVAASDYPNALSNATLGASAGEIAAAYVAMENKNFYNATLVNLITPWTNEAQAVFPEDMDDEGILNDYTTTVIGVVRDDDDFRKILFDDVLYIGNTARPELSTGYSYSSNAHFQQLQDSGLNLGYVDDPNPTGVGPTSVGANDVLLKVSQASRTGGVLDNLQTAGVMTTRAGAKAFFVDGTNRAMFRFTVLNHLCNDMEQLKDATLPADRIRQDVSRSPGGDSRIYMNECVGCHTAMDPLTQAFAYYEYNKATTTLEYTDAVVQPKNLINADNFKPGYITTDDSWTNYWREGKNSVVGDNVNVNTKIDNWDLSLAELGSNGKRSSGQGAQSMGKELAYSEMFARCQVEKVFQAVCLRKPGDSVDHTAVNSILGNFKSSYMVNSGPGYELKQVFAETAAYCKGQ